MNIELPTLHEAMLCLPGKLVSSEYPDYGKYMWLCDEGDRVLTPVRMITNEPTGPEEFL